MLLKDDIVALQQQGASLDLIRDDRAVSRGDDRQFNLITTTSPIQSPRRLCSERNPPTSNQDRPINPARYYGAVRQ
jgi:hypothetical protein